MFNEQLLSFVLILGRVSAFIAFFPLFSQRQLPALVKAGLAVGLTIFWFGSVPVGSGYPAQIPTLLAVLLMVREIGIGVLLAMTLGFMLIPARIAGAYAGQEVGLSLASISDPSTSDQSTLVTKVFETLAVLLFFGLNLHHFLILFLHASMKHLADKIDLLDLPTDGLVRLVSDLPEQGLLILAPVAIVMFLLTVGLSLLNKAAPTLNLFSVGMSLRSGLGIVCLIVFLPVMMQAIAMFFMRTINDLEKMMVYWET
jgi:flagellar biosynthetic protein FliR